jgi:predicted peptidase
MQASGSLEKMAQWTNLVSNLVPLLFIMRFSQELKRLKTNNENTSHPLFSESKLGVVGVLALLTILGFGGVFAHESYMSIYWTRRNLEKSQQLARVFEAHTFVGSQGDTLLYRLLKPLNYDSTKKYPLVVSLHHGGDHGSDNIRQTGSQPAAILSTEENRKKYPAFHFVPQCPQSSAWGGNASYPAIDSLVFEAIYALEQKYAIDEKRRYIGGISGGGFGSWYFIATRPHMFSAAIPICGGGDPSLAPNMVDVAVWAFHGEWDRLAPVSGSRDMIEAIKKAGGNPRYTEYPETGHSIGHQVFQTPGLLDWLFAQERD